MPTAAAPRPSPDAVARLALAALLLGAVAIGFSGVFVRLSELGPSATAFHRMALALPVFALWMGLERRGAAGAVRPAGRRDAMVLVAAGLLFAADLVAFHWSLMLTSVANATLLSNFAPVFVTLGAWLIFGERVSGLFILGMLTALAGAAVLVGRSLGLGPDNFLGDALGLATSVFYGGYLLTVAWLRARFSTATIMAWSGAVTAAALLPVAILSGEGLLAQTAFGWAILAAVALISQAGGQGLIAYALAHLPAAFSSVSLLVQPVAAAVFAWIILGEALGWLQGAGGALVLAGILLARRGSRR